MMKEKIEYKLSNSRQIEQDWLNAETHTIINCKENDWRIKNLLKCQNVIETDEEYIIKFPMSLTFIIIK